MTRRDPPSPCGQLRYAIASAGTHVGEYRLEPSYRHRLHTHPHRGVAIGLTGTYVAELGRREHPVSAGDVLVFPENAGHREWAGERGSRCLLVQFAGGRFEDRACESVFARDAVMYTPMVRRLASLIATEVAVDDHATPIGLDALVADLIGELAALRSADPSAPRRDWVWAVRETLDADFLEPPSLSALATTFGRSREHLARSFRRAFGITVGGYVRRRRLDHAARTLATTECSLTALAHAVGFADHSHFTRWFRRRYGVTPTQYRRARIRPAGQRDAPAISSAKTRRRGVRGTDR